MHLVMYGELGAYCEGKRSGLKGFSPSRKKAIEEKESHSKGTGSRLFTYV